MSHKRIRGQVESERLNKIKGYKKENNSIVKLYIFNLGAILLFSFIFLMMSLNTKLNSDIKFSIILTVFSINFTFATEIKDWNEYHVDKIGLKNCKLGAKVIYYIPAFSISLLLFNTLLTIGIITKDNFHTDWINTLSVLILIAFIISYSIRQIKFKYDEYYKEINKKNI